MKTILFDLDGTLIDSTEAIVESFQVAFSNFDYLQPNSQAICALIGHPLEYMFTNLGVKDSDITTIVGYYKEHYRPISTQKTFLLPGAKESIILAKDKARLGVVTTKTGKYSKEILQHLGILHYFDVVIGREDVKHPKPHKEPILKALHALHVKPSKSVYMIGDTCLDMNSALDAKVRGIGVLSGYGKIEDLKKCTHDIFKTSLDAIEKINTL